MLIENCRSSVTLSSRELQNINESCHTPFSPCLNCSRGGFEGCLTHNVSRLHAIFNYFFNLNRLNEKVYYWRPTCNVGKQATELGESNQIILGSFIGGLTLAACSLHLITYSLKLPLGFSLC